MCDRRSGATGKPARLRLGDCFTQADGVPVDDDGGEQVEICHAVVLALGAAIPDLSLAWHDGGFHLSASLSPEHPTSCRLPCARRPAAVHATCRSSYNPIWGISQERQQRRERQEAADENGLFVGMNGQSIHSREGMTWVIPNVRIDKLSCRPCGQDREEDTQRRQGRVRVPNPAGPKATTPAVPGPHDPSDSDGCRSV